MCDTAVLQKTSIDLQVFRVVPHALDFFDILSLDRGRVVGGLPDVVTIMEEKVTYFCTVTYSHPIF